MPVSLQYAKQASNPAISVVIPSIPAYDHERTVAHLQQQTLTEPYEIIVVNDGTIDRSTARNRGLAAATADIVAFTDDDTEPPAEWLAVIHEMFTANPDLGCLEGSIYGGCRDHGPRHYVGCNLAVRRDQALAVGGFRQEFSTWREDVEFGWRMERDAEGACHYCPDMRMCHPTVPRTAFKPRLERKLKAEYPDRYETIMNATRRQRLYRWARALGVTQPIHRLLNRLGFSRSPSTHPHHDREMVSPTESD